VTMLSVPPLSPAEIDKAADIIVADSDNIMDWNSAKELVKLFGVSPKVYKKLKMTTKKY
jgi:hypothetical protein